MGGIGGHGLPWGDVGGALKNDVSDIWFDEAKVVGVATWEVGVVILLGRATWEVGVANNLEVGAVIIVGGTNSVDRATEAVLVGIKLVGGAIKVSVINMEVVFRVGVVMGGATEVGGADEAREDERRFKVLLLHRLDDWDKDSLIGVVVVGGASGCPSLVGVVTTTGEGI